MFDEELDLIDTSACNIEPCLMSLAACKLEDPKVFAPKFREFRRQLQGTMRNGLSDIDKNGDGGSWHFGRANSI